MNESHWLEQFFGIEVAHEVDTDCPQRKVPVRLERIWRSGLVCHAARPSFNGQLWLPFVPEGERTGCHGCLIQRASLAFLLNDARPDTETERWLREMERFAKLPP